MLEQQMWFRYEEALPIAYKQCLHEGKAVEADCERMKEIAGMAYGDPEKKKRAAALLDRWESLPVRADFPYEEPDGLEEIERLTGAGGRNDTRGVDIQYDKVYGAWLGRSAGCLLGQPVEGWYQDRLLGLSERKRESARERIHVLRCFRGDKKKVWHCG